MELIVDRPDPITGRPRNPSVITVDELHALIRTLGGRSAAVATTGIRPRTLARYLAGGRAPACSWASALCAAAAPEARTDRRIAAIVATVEARIAAARTEAEHRRAEAAARQSRRMARLQAIHAQSRALTGAPTRRRRRSVLVCDHCGVRMTRRKKLLGQPGYGRLCWRVATDGTPFEPMVLCAQAPLQPDQLSVGLETIIGRRALLFLAERGGTHSDGAARTRLVAILEILQRVALKPEPALLGNRPDLGSDTAAVP